jgi:hypothetical protein
MSNCTIPPRAVPTGRRFARPSRRQPAGTLAALCSTILLAACGAGGDGADPSAGATAPAAASSAPSPAAPPGAPTPGPTLPPPAAAPSTERLQTLWPMDALRHDVRTNRVESAPGFDLGDRYLWIVQTNDGTVSPSAKRWTALTSADLTTFSQQDILLDGIPAGTPLPGGFGAHPPHKIVRFGGRFHGIPQYSGGPSSPATFYSSDDAIDWRSPAPLTIGATRYSFRGSDIATNCPYAFTPGNACDPPYDLAANDTTLMLRLYDRILSTRDLVNWTAALLPRDCYGFTGIAALPGRAVIAAARSGHSCVSEDNGITWRVAMHTVDTRGITLDGYGFKPGAPSVAGERFVSTGGYVYRPYWFTSPDGLQWTLQAGPTPAPACAGSSGPVNDTIAFTGTRWVNLGTVCESPGAAVSLSVSADGTQWRRDPLPAANATALLVTYPEHGTSVGSVGRNAVVVRGTDDMLVFGQPSVTAPFGLMRVRF